MNASKFFKTFFLLLISAILLTSVTVAQDKGAQDKKDEPVANPDGSYSTKSFNEAERPEDSYLAKFQAMDVVSKLINKNLEQIYLLKVIVSNFSDKGWKDDYDKSYTGYKKGMEYYYKRNLIYSKVEFENNKKAISELLKKMADQYKKDTNDMLGECADKIMMLHLDAKTKSDPNKREELFKNQMRLRIAYGQFDDASNSTTEHNYESALYHYRVAKTYAIKILEELAKPEEQDSIKEKYKFHKADNLNRIFEAKKEDAKKEEPKKEEPKK